jgi:hypothetical protein
MAAQVNAFGESQAGCGGTLPSVPKLLDFFSNLS